MRLLLACMAFLTFECLPPLWAETKSLEKAITKIKREFKDKTPLAQTLNIEELAVSLASSELADPQTMLPQIHRLELSEATRFHQLTQDCSSASQTTFRDKSLQKAYIWHSYNCKHIARLPDNFFETPPFIHPFGGSFSKKGSAKDRRFYHLSEILGIELLPGQLSSLLNQERLVLSQRHIFIATAKNKNENSKLHYLVYAREDWDDFLSGKHYKSIPYTSGAVCLSKDGNACWIENPTYNESLYLFLFVYLSILILLVLVYLILLKIRRSKKERQDNEQRLFILQMLTHELRTPAAALKLSTEVLRDEFDELPQESQKSFLRICEELQRLDRVVDASKKYLSANREQDFKSEVQTSVNELIESILDGYDDSVKFHPLESDREIKIARYWIELCLKNLVSNALQHGQSPVEISIRSEKNNLYIDVADQGSTLPATLQEMIQPLRKGESSMGLGLGLSIVTNIMLRLDGELIYTPAPKKFTLCFRNAL